MTFLRSRFRLFATCREYAPTRRLSFLSASNFAPPSLQGPSNNLDGVGEAVGGINSLELALMPDEEQEWDLYPDDPFPPLKFEGESTGPTGSRFRGLVKMLEGGYRHWEFTIRYSGSDRWVTSGVEVGGRGVYGEWGIKGGKPGQS